MLQHQHFFCNVNKKILYILVDCIDTSQRVTLTLEGFFEILNKNINIPANNNGVLFQVTLQPERLFTALTNILFDALMNSDDMSFQVDLLTK